MHSTHPCLTDQVIYRGYKGITYNVIGKNKVRTGKFIIALGAGLGLIGLIVSIIVGLTEGNLTLNTLISLGAIGLILSIVARMMAK